MCDFDTSSIAAVLRARKARGQGAHVRTIASTAKWPAARTIPEDLKFH